MLDGHADAAPRNAACDLRAWLTAHAPALVLSGAGCSTDSGIPDYRDAAGNWKRSQPIQYRQFVGSGAVRQRYWARSLIGFSQVLHTQPNAAHRALASLQRQGIVSHVVTQNVDGLHQRAGSEDVLELHGNLHSVECLSCNGVLPRERYQERLREENPDFSADVTRFAPDGDADLRGAAYERFVVPACGACGGVYKPSVVFFGETVPPHIVAEAYQRLEAARSLLVVGTSLMVFSGYRFARRAHEHDQPIAVVNLGRTRADDMAALKVTGNCGTILSSVLEPTPQSATAS